MGKALCVLTLASGIVSAAVLVGALVAGGIGATIGGIIAGVNVSDALSHNLAECAE